MPVKQASDTDEQSGNERSDNFHVVPSTYDENDEDHRQSISGEEDHLLVETALGDEEDEAPPPEPVQWHPALVMISSMLMKICRPIFRILFAPRTQRTAVKTVVIATTVAWLIMTSVAAYLMFYRRYVPQITHIEPVWFQYETYPVPTDYVDLTRGTQYYAPLRHEQAYDVSVRLHVPTSDINFDVGNFMVTVDLQTANGTSLMFSSRPAILRYQSGAQRILHVFAKALPLLVGLAEESQTVVIPMMEGYMEHKANPMTKAKVTLSSSRVQVYDAQLQIIADFRGLRYHMYHHRIPTAITFIAMFAVIELICAAIAWKSFGQNFWNKLHAAFEQVQGEPLDLDDEKTDTSGDDAHAIPSDDGSAIDE
ncbi:Berardinelli-Seip congenital lipodystrophy 2 (seipin) [Apophysomyces sp. BC1034]|nr:Berardinelli-Seip congenital lipodystrophy 2 (seipin) [Apophysomyces sp. BC1015]KAG0182352.1 Berardinelli-Seip congenital lipodystrophy 2 (seipin) [Apophysomyces sp. BC1021]KAG0194528.1 Berardinelli-Seip congenital lipodystrophy 2 (seipin) [Apophysomyces sp. BC1034]